MMKFYKLDHSVNNGDIRKFNFDNQRIGVIAHIEDENGKILLQQRGLKSRDENGLYEDVGGSVENSDVDFKAAIIREMQEEMGNDVKIYKMNVDDSPETASQFGIRSIPTMFLFKDGKQVDTKVGLNTQSTISSWIESYK